MANTHELLPLLTAWVSVIYLAEITPFLSLETLKAISAFHQVKSKTTDQLFA